MAKGTPTDLIKPSVLAKELGIQLSVIYGYVKRGVASDYRTPADQSAMVSRAEVDAARSSGRNAKRAARASAVAAGEELVEKPKSPLKAGSVVSRARTARTRERAAEGAKRIFGRVDEVMVDSDTGMAFGHDSNGKELFWTADDAKTLLANGQLSVEDPMWLLDAVGAAFIAEGREDWAQRLGQLASEFEAERATEAWEEAPQEVDNEDGTLTSPPAPKRRPSKARMTAVARQRAKRAAKA